MKKIFASILCTLILNLCVPVNVFAYDSNYIEHLNLPKKLAKKTPTDVVNISDEIINVDKYNTLPLVFTQDFSSKNAQVGDEIVFMTKDNICTKEGTLVFPPSTYFIANIIKVEKPKSFNRSGKVYIEFQCVKFPDGTEMPLNAKIFNKKEFLSRGKLNAVGKSFGSAFGGLAVGTAAGCGIGIAAGAVIIGGLAIGLPIGLGVGLIGGSLTPGLYYKAKAGDKINIQLLDDITIEK